MDLIAGISPRILDVFLPNGKEVQPPPNQHVGHESGPGVEEARNCYFSERGSREDGAARA